MNANLFHGLEGTNIYFKPLNPEDAQEIHNFASDVEVSRFIGWRLMERLEDTREYIEEMLKRETIGSHLYASIVLKSTNAIIGTAMMFNFDRQANHAEIGYVLHRDYWGQGYATEAIAMMNDFAFKTMNFHKLHARVVGANMGSKRVLEKTGYQLEGQFKDYYFIDGVYYDGLFYGKIQS